MRSIAGFLTIGALILTHSAAPARADGKYEPVELLHSEEQLMKTVTEYEDLFVRRGYRYSSPDVEGMVSRIGGRLAPPPTDPYIRYRFHILRDPEANAFALPDGQIYLNTGILALLENEAQLAGLMGHEVTHTAGHHGLIEHRSVRRSIVGLMVSGMLLGPIATAAGNVFLGLALFGYSRELEAEADDRGERRMLQAGYDPRQMSRLFEILMQDPEEEQPKRATAWSTHPQLQARVETTRALADEAIAGIDPETLRVEAAGYRRMVRRICLDTVQDLIGADYPRSAYQLADRLTTEDPADAPRFTALGDAARALGARAMSGGESAVTDTEKKANIKLRLKLTREESEAARLATPEGQENLRRNLETARRAYSRALELDPDSPEARRGLGLTLEQMGDVEAAGRHLVLYLRARPDAPDRPVLLQHLDRIMQALRKSAESAPSGTGPDKAAPEPGKPVPEPDKAAPGDENANPNR
jgi:predicted Zn-dependent protease